MPFFQALLHGKGQRGNLLVDALRQVIVPLAVACILDSILQYLINGRVRPIAALIVGGLLVFPLFLIVRALANRIWTHNHSGHDRPAKQAG